MLTLQHITTGYGKKQVLTDVSFHVNDGEIVILTGGNGSGKSTILKTIYGLLKPWTSEGQILYDGNNITALPAYQMLDRGIVYMPQKNNIFDSFTVEENLLTSGNIYNKTDVKQRINRVFDIFPILKDLRQRSSFNLSGGERQLLALANALIHSPRLVLLDEPFAGADEVNSGIMVQNIIDINNQGVTLIIVEHKTELLQPCITREIQVEMGIIKN